MRYLSTGTRQDVEEANRLMSIARIRGQERALRTLGLALVQGRLHHAYRFQGPDGVGKETTALALAAILECGRRTTCRIPAGEGRGEIVEIPDGCGACADCRNVDSGTHADVALVAPEKGKAVISIAQIREVTGFAHYAPGEGKHKVVIVREADRITEEGANALLKVLEEPPRSTHFILITSRPHKLLPTISSRSIPIRFSPLSPGDLRAVLTGLGHPEGEALDGAISMSGGSVHGAIRILSGETMEVLENVVLLDNAIDGGAGRVVDLLDDLPLSREGAMSILHFLEIWYRDVAFFGVTGRTDGLTLHPLADRIDLRSRTLDAEDACTLALLIPEHRDLLEGNVNPRMVLGRLAMAARRDER